MPSTIHMDLKWTKIRKTKMKFIYCLTKKQQTRILLFFFYKTDEFLSMCESHCEKKWRNTRKTAIHDMIAHRTDCKQEKPPFFILPFIPIWTNAVKCHIHFTKAVIPIDSNWWSRHERFHITNATIHACFHSRYDTMWVSLGRLHLWESKKLFVGKIVSGGESNKSEFHSNERERTDFFQQKKLSFGVKYAEKNWFQRIYEVFVDFWMHF